MCNEVGRNAAFRLDSGATRLAVRLDLTIFTLKYDIEVIQDGYFRNWRHWSEQLLRSRVKSAGDLSPRNPPHLAPDHKRKQADVFTSQSPDITLKKK